MSGPTPLRKIADWFYRVEYQQAHLKFFTCLVSILAHRAL